MIANCWLRPGNTGSANNVQAFLSNTLHRLGDKRVCLLRADSGFCDSAFLDDLEERQMHYVIALRQNQPLQRALVDVKDWWALHDEAGKPVPGIELNRFMYQANAWSKARPVIGIRQHVDQRVSPKGKTLNLFADDPIIGKYRYSALVTDLDLPAVTVWRTYRGRADCENRIKELKYDFAADSFNMKDFWATEAALNTVMLAYSTPVGATELDASGVTQKQCGQTFFQYRATLTANPAIQTFCKTRLPHHRKPKNDLEFGFGNAAANMDAGLVGRIKIFRFARQIYAHLRTLISG